MDHGLREAIKRTQKRVRDINEANGWFEEERTIGDDVALIHSEASEMLEAYRDWGLDDHTEEEVVGLDGATLRLPKPEGFGSECADVLIRLLDTVERRGIDLAYETERKLRYNATRGHRHGGKLI